MGIFQAEGGIGAFRLQGEWREGQNYWQQDGERYKEVENDSKNQFTHAVKHRLSSACAGTGFVWRGLLVRGRNASQTVPGGLTEAPQGRPVGLMIIS